MRWDVLCWKLWARRSWGWLKGKVALCQTFFPLPIDVPVKGWRNREQLTAIQVVTSPARRWIGGLERPREHRSRRSSRLKETQYTVYGLLEKRKKKVKWQSWDKCILELGWNSWGWCRKMPKTRRVLVCGSDVQTGVYTGYFPAALMNYFDFWM